MKELRLVIVDDEELAIQNLEEQIEAINGPYRIVGTARNGVQAWELLQKVKPDVAFIDIKMPVLTGLELAKKIKDEHMKTEVVLVSAYQEFEYAKQGIELGICQYILKHEVGSASLSKLLEQLWNKWNTEQITTTFSVQSILGAIVNGAYVQSQIKEHFIKAKEELKTFSILMVQRNAPIHFANSGSFLEQPSPVNVEEILIRKKEELHLIAVLPYHGAHVLLFHKPFESYLLRMGYYGQGLRMIEIYKHQFQDLSSIIAQVKNRNYRFIIYMDDLSFEDFEIEYKFLKAVIEGGMETRPDNVLIYATSNRRHLIKESWSDRDDMETDNGMHRSDTMQEKLSLVARFGVTIYYGKPSQKEYFTIVKELRKRYPSITLTDEELCAEANKWELSHGGISGRTAQQFINYMAGMAPAAE